MPLLIITGLLLLYGVLALFSVSVHESFSTTLSLINRWRMEGDPSNYFFFFKQISNFLYVAIVAYIVYLTPLKLFRNDKFLLGLSIAVFIFQLLVFTPLGSSYGGAQWWITIGSTSIQPVEFFKIGYIIFMAWWFVRKQHLLNSMEILKKFFILHFILFFVFLMIPDLGWVLLMGMTGFIMAIYAWVNIKNMLRMAWLWLIVVAVAVWSLISVTDNVCVWPVEDRPGICKYTYLTNRVKLYFDPSIDSTGRNISRQNRQAVIAIWWWWFFWRWYGKWLQKFGYIPEAQSDFIFSAFAEEIWFVGVMVLLWLYLALMYYVLIRIPLVKDPFFRNLSVWLISMIMVEAFVHIGVNTHLLPNTGLTLPFVSYGGTALMTNVLSIVLLYKILYKYPHKLT